MPELSLVEHSHVTKNAMLVAKVAKALRIEPGAEREGQVPNAVLDRGAEFLHRVIESAVLVEDAAEVAGFHASARGLNEFGHALSALRVLKLIVQEDGVAEQLASMRNDLVSLAKGEVISRERRDGLRRFFSVLSKVFEEEVLGIPPVSLSPPPSQMHLASAP